MILFSLALACNGCFSCTPPDLTAGDWDIPDLTETDEDTSEDTDEDSAEDSGEPIEPPCPIMEEEPNNNYDEAQLVLLENWICGRSEAEFDLDNYGFIIPEDGWIKIWGRSQDIGSTSDLLLTLNQDANTAVSVAQMGTTDPLLIVPMLSGDIAYATIYDQYGGSEESDFYEMIISQVKQPVEFTDIEPEETEENNSPSGAVELSSGMRMFGSISANSDLDWYRISLPEEQKVKLTITVEAFAHGSPLDSIIYVYPSEVFESTETSYERIRDNAPGNAGNLDPTLSYTPEEGGDKAILIKSDVTGGSDFHWYVLEILVEEIIEETE